MTCKVPRTPSAPTSPTATGCATPRVGTLLCWLVAAASAVAPVPAAFAAQPQSDAAPATSAPANTQAPQAPQGEELAPQQAPEPSPPAPEGQASPGLQELPTEAAPVDTTRPGPVQSPATARPFSPEHRWLLYEQSRLQSSTATWYSLALPGLGNLYAEQYFEAGLSFAALAFSVVFLGFGLRTDNNEILAIGSTTAVLTYAGSTWWARRGVEEYNLRLREGLRVQEPHPQAPTDKGPGVQWSLRF